MTEVKNSALLDKIIEYSKNIGEKRGAAFSAERFIVAVCDLIDGPFSAQEADAGSIIRLSSILRRSGADTQQLRSSLLQYINDDKRASFMDGLYIQKKTFEAKELAQKDNNTVLTPEHLLECVLKDPTDAIKASLPQNSAAHEEPKPAEGDKEDHSDLSELFDTLFESGEGEKETSEQQPAEEEQNADPKKTVAELTEKIKCAREKLLSKVFGQDNAVNVFVTGYFQAELLSLTDKSRVRPRATFLFAGPPGVGKTFLAEQAAKVLDLPFMRFDMSEYSDHEANVEFCGSDKVYKNGKPGNVTGFVEEHPRCVLLFDEIEKAHINVIHLFLQMLDAGRLRDNHTDTEVSFKDAIIIFTTNAGKQLYEQSESGDFSGISRKVILKALQKDVHSDTGVPFFPPAMCSRFASGNVVMFNHITAHNLREIAKREVLRHANNFEKEIGISVSIDESVYTALLFAEGGAADARTIRSRSESFFDDEIYELFRLVGSDKTTSTVEGIDHIKISVALPENDKQIVSLFDADEPVNVLAFSPKQAAEFCSRPADNCHLLTAQTVEEAKKLLHDHDISVVVIDYQGGAASRYLNAEDIESAARDFFFFAREYYHDLPVYLLQTGDARLNGEEIVSFMKQGIRGVLSLADGADGFARDLSTICSSIHQQRSMAYLAKSNKIISFETAQSLSDDGKTAEITLFDFEMSTAIDAEDSGNIMSNVSKPNVRFDAVIGAKNAKDELRFFVDYLKHPKRFAESGLRAPKGVLLYGPPGTGKTMLAKATAAEADVTFISAEGNQFIKKFIGEGKDALHELFVAARKYAPSILFIDELEAIAKERVGGEHAAANGEDVLTALLTEMDGFHVDESKPVFVLAATNFSVQPGTGKSLDQALLRRFDSKIYVDLPDKSERAQFIGMKTNGNPAFAISEEEKNNLVIRSTGMSLADLDSVFALALRVAIRTTSLKVTDKVLDEAFETFVSGEAKTWDVSQLERVARHEAGHAFLCWKSGETPSYLTIVARGDHGGYMQHDDNEGKAIYTKEELLNRIRTALGGRAAEIVCYGDRDGISTGASGDLETATALAQQIICTYGMDDEFGLAVIDSASAKSSSEVRARINQILGEQMKQATDMIAADKDAIDAIVAELMAKNHLSGPEIGDIFSRYAKN